MDNNMVSDAKGVPHAFRDSERKLDVSAARWVTRLESGLNPDLGEHASLSVADGRVYVGCNNNHPKLDHIQGDRGVLLCLDVNGMADGNDGPFTDELNYLYGDDEAAGKTLTHLDADIIWIYDLRNELGAFPHNATSGSPLIVGDLVYVTVPNGVEFTHARTPASFCPALVAIDKKSGELYSEEDAGVSSRMVHTNWSTPSFGIFDQIPTVVYGGADGWTYGFHARETESVNDGGDIYRLMKMVWRVDCFPSEHRFTEAGDPITYPRAFKRHQPGPSEIIASPVIHGDRIYVALGREHLDDGGNGLLTCIAPGRDGEDARIVWQNKDIAPTLSNPTVADGLLYIGDSMGVFHCLDAATGKHIWRIRLGARICGSALLVDGKVYVGRSEALVILRQGRTAEVVRATRFPAKIEVNCVVANGILYVLTDEALYAFDCD